MGENSLNTELLLELIFSIDTDTSEEEVLKKCCPVFIRKLNAVMVAVFKNMPENGKVHGQYFLPLSVKNTSSWNFLIDFIHNNKSQTANGFCQLEYENNYWYIYCLHDYGYFVLGRKKQIDFVFINELKSVFSFLAKILTQSVEKEKRLETEKRLADEHQLLRTIIDNLPINIYVKDLNYNKIVANKSEIKHLGVTDEAEVLNKDDSFFYSDEQVERGRREDEQVLLRGKSILNKEASIGNGRWALISKLPLKTSEGIIKGLVGISVDFTERKQMEEQLWLLTNLLDNSSDAIQVSHENGQMVFINKTASSRLGIPQEDITNYWVRDFEKIFEDTEKWNEHLEELKTLDFLTIEGVNIHRQTGKEFPVEVTAKYVSVGGEGYVIANSRDITDRKLKELQLKLSEEKYRRIMENMELGFMEVDNEGVVVRAYDRFCQMTGYEEAELVGKKAVDILLLPEFKALMEEQTSMRSHGAVSSYEMQIRKKNGELIWVLVSGGPVFDENGNTIGSVGIHYDITQQKQVQEELEKAKKVAEDAQKAEQTFLANMSHEIRTPLNAIIGIAHLLFDTNPTTEQKEYFEVIKNSANFLHTLLSDILDMAKIEAGKIEPKQEEFDLIGLLRTIHRTFQLKTQPKDLHVSLLIDESMNRLFIGDETLINQILLNIVGNAEKFTEKGRISIAAEMLEKTTDKCIVEFRVSDTGIGMSEEKQHVIFEKFKQIHDKNAPKAKGTGLGLSIVKELLELQGGSIAVRSKPAKGTTFMIRIPLGISKRERIIKETVSPAVEHINYNQAAILIVEDNAMNRMYASKLLEKWNIKQVHANDGQEAVEIATKQRFDLILMDIQMPIMDGYEAAIQIRNSVNPNQNTPIIALTASVMVAERNKALNVGMNGVLTKPFMPVQLEEILSKFLPSLSPTN